MGSTTIQYFVYDHLRPDLQEVVKPIADLAHLMEDSLPDGAEKSAGMRKLLEAKDCFVRSMLDKKGNLPVPVVANMVPGAPTNTIDPNILPNNVPSVPTATIDPNTVPGNPPTK